MLKFSQNQWAEDVLAHTDSAVLVEASPYDTIWGIGMKESNPAAKHPPHWNGENLLGFVLMDVREALYPEKFYKLRKGPGTWEIGQFSNA